MLEPMRGDISRESFHTGEWDRAVRTVPALDRRPRHVEPLRQLVEYDVFFQPATLG